ncbi:MAG: hypothetical protein AB1716_04410 [Planctomycetota bacterium]
MTAQGRIRNGTIVLDTPLGLPEGAAVEIEVREIRANNRAAPGRNVSKLVEGICYDFDALDRLREASKL